MSPYSFQFLGVSKALSERRGKPAGCAKTGAKSGAKLCAKNIFGGAKFCAKFARKIRAFDLQHPKFHTKIPSPNNSHDRGITTVINPLCGTTGHAEGKGNHLPGKIIPQRVIFPPISSLEGNLDSKDIEGQPVKLRSAVKQRGRERKGPPEMIQKFRLRNWPI